MIGVDTMHTDKIKALSLLTAVIMSVTAAGCGAVEKGDAGNEKPVTEAATSSAETAKEQTETTVTTTTDETRKADESSSAAEKSETTTAATSAAETEKPKETTEATTAKKEEPAATESKWTVGECTLTIPAGWSGRYVTDGNSIYCKKCYDAENGSGMIFSVIESSDAPNYPNAFLLGIGSSGNYYYGIKATGATFDVSDSALLEEYNSLSAETDSIMYTAYTPGANGHTPFDVSKYSAYDPEGEASGLWINDPYSGAQVSPSIIIDNDRDQVYYYGYAALDDHIIGDVVWNTAAEPAIQGNLIDRGLLFINGSVYTFDIYSSAPRGISFSCVMGSGSDLDGKSFMFEKDYDALYTIW